MRPNPFFEDWLAAMRAHLDSGKHGEGLRPLYESIISGAPIERQVPKVETKQRQSKRLAKESVNERVPSLRDLPLFGGQDE